MSSGIAPPGRGPDWANLLPEILAVIANRLAALDYLNFSAVCASWASIASPGYGMPPPLPIRKPRPFLLLRGDDGEQDESLTLLDILDDPRRSYKIGRLPAIGGKWFVGSQFGWVALLDELSNPSLLNPFTGDRVELPPITTLPNVKPVHDSDGSTSGYFHPLVEESYSLEEFRAAFPIRKLVVSSDPAGGHFAAAAILGFCRLMFLRPGERAWSYWDKQFESVNQAVIEVMYRQGKFLALTEPGEVHEIDPFDPSVEDSVVAKADGRYSPLRYLVDSSGDLLHVYRDSTNMAPMSTTNEIDVKRLDAETGSWVTVPSLGDRALFIGASHSMLLPAGGEHGVRGSCIYFTDNNWDILSAPDVKIMARDLGVFDMVSRSFEILYPPKPQFKWPPPIWIMSPLFCEANAKSCALGKSCKSHHLYAWFWDPALHPTASWIPFCSCASSWI